MIITCGECDSSFVLDDKLIKPNGSKVRCSNCMNIFLVYPAVEETVSEPEPPKAPKVERKETPAAIPQDDPDLSKALAEVDDEELDFTNEELGIKDDAQAVPAKAIADEPASEIPDSDEVSEDDEGILDFSDFELDMDEEDLPPEVAAVEDDADDLELDFDMDEEPELEGGEEELDLSLDDDEELDFSDLALELEGDDESPDMEPTRELNISDLPGEIDSADTVVMEEAELDFSEIDFGEEDEAGAPPPVPEEDMDLGMDKTESLMDDELDFSDLERELDGVLDEPASEDELDLELASGVEDAEPETILMDEEDLDFSEFEFETDETGTDAPDQSKDAAQVIEDELDFSSLADILDSDAPPEDIPGDPEEIDLELDLDLDSEDSPAMESAVAEEDDEEEELDFSDLENILDDMDEGAAGGLEGPDEDVKLELDESIDDSDDLKGEKPMAEAEEDLDFSDVEAMLDVDDDPDLDLDIDLDAEAEKDLSFDTDDDELSLGLDDEDGGDIELELDMDDESSADEEPEAEEDEEYDEEPADLSAIPAPVLDDEYDEKTADDKKKARKKAKRKAKGKGGKILKWILVIIILAALICFGIYMVRDTFEKTTGVSLPEIKALDDLRTSIGNMDIPGISSLVKPSPQDPQGKLFLKTSGINGKVVVSTKVGELFVITGKIKNDYPETRNSLNLVGKLFGEGGKVVQSKLFYAGNVIPEEELLTMDEDLIKKRLQNRLGDNGINAKVRPGQIVPFMVVFTNLSESLTEFSVEVAGSYQGAAIK